MIASVVRINPTNAILYHMKSLSLNQPHAIVMVGIPGSGKSFFAKQFSDTFNAPYIAINDILPHAKNEQAAHVVARRQLDELLKTKLSMIVELDTTTRTARRELAAKLRGSGYKPLIVWVQTDPDAAFTRHKRSGNSEESFDGQIRRFSPPHESENPIVLSGKHTFATQARVILKHLSAPRAEIANRKIIPERNHNISVK